MNKGFTTLDVLKSVSGKIKTAGSTGATQSGTIDLGELSELGVHSEQFELEIYTPALTTTHLPSNTRVTYVLQFSDSSEFSSTDDVTLGGFAQTGGTAVAAATYRYRVPLDAKRYCRLQATTAATSPAVTGTGIGDLVFGIRFYC